MVDLVKLASANASRWSHATLTRNFDSIAQRLVNAKPRYQSVSRQTGVPWPIIAVIHMRESSQDWTRSLAQGDPWNRVSTHVPAGRGPFDSWESAAVDALVKCAPYLAANADWSLGRTLAKLEAYNGLGYAAKGVPSPYLWAGTNQYKAGKYVRDGVYDGNVVDTQPGCAGLLMAMIKIDPTITFLNTTITTTSPPPAVKPVPAPPSIANPSQGSIGAFILNLFNSIFRRK